MNINIMNETVQLRHLCCGCHFELNGRIFVRLTDGNADSGLSVIEYPNMLLHGLSGDEKVTPRPDLDAPEPLAAKALKYEDMKVGKCYFLQGVLHICTRSSEDDKRKDCMNLHTGTTFMIGCGGFQRHDAEEADVQITARRMS